MERSSALHRALEAVRHLTDPEPPWNALLESSCRLLGGDSASLITLDRDFDLLDVQQWNVDPQATRAYTEHYFKFDIVTPKSIGAIPGTWLNTQEMYSADVLSRNEYYADFLTRYGMPQMLTCVVEETAAERCGLSIQRSRIVPYARRDLETTAIRSFTQALRTAMDERRERAMLWLANVEPAFAQYGEAIVLADRKGRLRHPSTSNMFEHLASRFGIRLRDGTLWTADAKLHALILGSLAIAARTVQRVERLTVKDPKSGARGTIDIVRAHTHLRFANEPLLMVRLSITTPRSVESLDVYCEAFDITSAEARVLHALTLGRTAAQCAVEFGVSIHTVRKQIAMLREKMGCHRQIDLVRKANAATSA